MPRVLRLAIPAGVICAVAVYLSYWAAQAGSSTLEENRTSAVITLFITTWWVLVLIAGPYVWWRVALVTSMAVLFALALATPFTRDFFALALGDLSNDLVAAGFGAAGAVALTIVFKIMRSPDISPGQGRSNDTLES